MTLALRLQHHKRRLLQPWSLERFVDLIAGEAFRFAPAVWKHSGKLCFLSFLSFPSNARRP